VATLVVADASMMMLTVGPALMNAESWSAPNAGPDGDTRSLEGDKTQVAEKHRAAAADCKAIQAIYQS
jgi:hypothetical protein